jgi:hypothetical protein
MGAGQSTPGTLTHEKIFELTKNTRSIMNILLEYMLKEITVRDFLALSNPTECKKYVLFMANNLHKHFYELQISPIKDKKGIIAFRPVKDLINPPESLEKEKQSLCLVLAYYYTRIFQIYGALALTLVDDANFMSKSGLITTEALDTTRTGLLPPGYTTYASKGGGANQTVSASSLGNFNFIRSFLYNVKPDTKKFSTKYTGRGESEGVIFFEKLPYERDQDGRPIIYGTMPAIHYQKGQFTIGYKGAKNYTTLDVYIKREGIGVTDLTFIFGKLKYNKKDSYEIRTIDLVPTVIPSKEIIIESQRPTTSSTYEYQIKGSNLTISEYFNSLFNKVIPYIKNLVEGAEIDTAGTTLDMESETGVTEELRLGRIIQNLTKTKPLGHCIARAIQLLRNVPLKDEPGISYICKAKFYEITSTTDIGTKKIMTRSGIPEPGTSLDASPGLASLSQLFYDTIIIGSPKIQIGTTRREDGKPSSLEQYIGFMKTMARLFGDDKTIDNTPRTDDELQRVGLKGIKNRRDRDLCTGSPENITVPSNTTLSVYEIVNQMYKIQLTHASNCGSIFKQLFEIQRDTSSGKYRISLSNNIIRKGFPEIERINYLARDVLIKYYASCEMKYLQGMKIVLDSAQTD